ncbi:PREDICTED: zinc finger MYM-type protein 1-like [Nicotiana attenuata]|uniref:zinc finger MYM-type protein 1-like n=1 Tax=Nicotiana attenuata TaxID=49451 RepID=UPI0009057D0D|nr:PREDICTED: zinc finger MYM-type protein 1-like [Nicotiana attenuata]
MALVLRYVNKEGELIERFLGLVHVKGTTAHALHKEIYSLLLQHSLSSSLIREQGYDGASNMQGNINGLKTLILKDNPSAHCIHCFAHQLQLTLVAIAKKHHDVNNFFDTLANVLNVVGGSYKHREMLRDDQAEKLDELLVLGEVHIGSGLNQELGLQRPSDTRWGSHFKTLRNFISLFSSIVHILGVLANEGSNYQEKALAKSLVEDIRSYEFVCILHLMLKLLAITYDLNMALQKKDQDIVSAMKLVDFTKRQLQTMRESKWSPLIEDVSSFCDKNGIVIPKMDENRFSEVNTALLLGMASLSPDDSFANYDKNKIMKLATYYPNEFTASKLEDLSFELDKYIDYVREMENAFSKLKGLGDLSKTLVKINIHKTWGLIYLLVKLSLILPVATATVERAFSSMNISARKLSKVSIKDANMSNDYEDNGGGLVAPGSAIGGGIGLGGEIGGGASVGIGGRLGFEAGPSGEGIEGQFGVGIGGGFRRSIGPISANTGFGGGNGGLDGGVGGAELGSDIGSSP